MTLTIILVSSYIFLILASIGIVSLKPSSLPEDSISFDYMIDTQHHGQIIIINNTDVTPAIDYKGGDANEIVFAGKEGEGRASLLEDIKDE